MSEKLNGVGLIAQERQRQIDSEGWTPEHDDMHDKGQMCTAARFYAEAASITYWANDSRPHVAELIRSYGKDPEEHENFCRTRENPARNWFGWDSAPKEWPWDASWWKPSKDPIRNLVKAGALIAAEIDRLLRQKEDTDENP